jgi:hypothetical protein
LAGNLREERASGILGGETLSWSKGRLAPREATISPSPFSHDSELYVPAEVCHNKYQKWSETALITGFILVVQKHWELETYYGISEQHRFGPRSADKRGRARPKPTLLNIANKPRGRSAAFVLRNQGHTQSKS